MGIIRSAVQILAGRLASILISFVTGIMLARFLGPEDRGIWAIYLYTLTLVSLLLNAGIPESSIYLLNKEKDRKTQIVGSQCTYLLLVAVLFFVAALLVRPYFGISAGVYTMLAISIVLTNFVSLFRHFLLAEKEISAYNFSVLFENGLYAILVIICCFTHLSLQNVVICYMSTLLVTLVLLALKIRSRFGTRLLGGLNPTMIRQSYRVGYSMFFAGLGGFGLQRINYYVLNTFAGSRAVGLFTVASTIPAIYENLPQQLSSIAYTYTSGDLEENYRRKMAIGMIKGVLYLMLLLSLPAIIFPEYIIRIIFGEEFAGTGLTMLVLVFGALLSGISGILFNMLAGIGKPGYGMYLTIINLGATFAASIVLVQYYGLMGAAFARLIATILSVLFIGFYFLRHYKLRFIELLWINRSEIFQLKKLIAARRVRS